MYQFAGNMFSSEKHLFPFVPISDFASGGKYKQFPYTAIQQKKIKVNTTLLLFLQWHCAPFLFFLTL